MERKVVAELEVQVWSQTVRICWVKEFNYATTGLRLSSVTVGFRRHSRQPMEERGEMTLVLEANAEAYLDQR